MSTLRPLKALILKDFRTSIREAEFLMYLLMPLVGALLIKLGGTFIDDPTPTPRDVVVVAAAPEAPVVQALEAIPLLKVQRADDWTTACERVRAGEASSAVQLPPGLLAGLGQAPPPEVRMFHAANALAAVATVRKTVSKVLDTLAHPVPSATYTHEYADGSDTPLSVTGIFLETAMLLAVMFGGLFIVPLGWSAEREHGQVEALTLAGISASTMLTARIIFGGLLTAGAGLGVVLIAHGPGALLPSALHLLPGALSLVAVGLAVSMFTRTRKQAELVLAVVMAGFSIPALASDAIPTLNAVGQWVPTGPLMAGLKATESGVGQPAGDWAHEMLVLTGYAAVCFALATWRVRRLDD